jgi:peptide/bleomycin uptake transporter
MQNLTLYLNYFQELSLTTTDFFIITVYFDVWVNLYDQFMVIVPYLVMAPSLFTGVITLGVIVQVSNAFQRVHNSFFFIYSSMDNNY